MRCKKKSHMGFFCGMLSAFALVGGVTVFMTTTRKGKKMARKAKRIAGEMEDFVKDELCMGRG